MHLLDLATFAVTRVDVAENPSGAALSPDGSMLAIAAQRGGVAVYRLDTGERIHAFEGHGDWAWHVCFAPSGLRLASSGSDNTIRIWSLSTGTQERVLGPFATTARFGRAWIDALYEELPACSSEHVVAHLEEDTEEDSA